MEELFPSAELENKLLKAVPMVLKDLGAKLYCSKVSLSLVTDKVKEKLPEETCQDIIDAIIMMFDDYYGDWELDDGKMEMGRSVGRSIWLEGSYDDVLDIQNTCLTELPTNIELSGDLSISNTKITPLPKGCFPKWYRDIYNI